MVFSLCAGLFYITVLFVWNRYAPSWSKPNINYRIASAGHMYSRLSEVKKYRDIDILFLGSSHTYRGFDPRIFTKHGLKTFNLGSSSQTPIQTEVLLNRYLKTLNPKMVIYEVYAETFMIDGVESSLDLIANDRNDLFSLKMALELNNIKTYNTLFYGFVCDLFNLNTWKIQSAVLGKDKYLPGGFVEKEMEYFHPVPIKQKVISINPKQLEIFSQIVSMLKIKHIDLVLVYAPIPSSSYKSYSNNSYYDSLMNGYSRYYNFNEIISLNDTLHFYDYHHLNQLGVEIFNTKLIEILKAGNNNSR